jgi:hypothetical protein
MRHSPIVVLATLTLSACGFGGESDNFAWNGDVPAGQWLRIRNTNGGVRVERAEGSQVEVTATRTRAGRRTERVKFAVVPGRDGSTTICVMRRRGGECSADDYRYGRTAGWLLDLVSMRRSAQVDFVVRLLRGVRMDASTVNGRLAMRGASSDVRAETVNGRVEIASAGGPVRAESVNGNIVAHASALGGDLNLETVNGSVTVHLPGAPDAEVDLETVNGSIRSDFPLTAAGRVDKRHVRARLGSGGRQIKAETVNGSVRLARGA